MSRFNSQALATVLLAAVLLVLASGCGDPIYAPIPFEPEVTNVELSVGSNESRYEWHLSARGYAVQKPPQMSFVNAITQRLSNGIDPVTAEVVPWTSDGMDEYLAKCLKNAFEPSPTELNCTLTIAPSELAGPQAFDISFDGSRLVTTNGRQLTLYNTNTAARIGNLPLPAEVLNSGVVEAVRFVGSSKDMLVASQSGFFRISSKDGSVSAKSSGCGEPIKKWLINSEATAMVVLTDSGRLLGGDPGLDLITTYDLGRLVIDDVALNPDGTRLAVYVKGKPRVYVQDQFQIVDQIELDGLEGAPRVSMACGSHLEAWVDGDRIFFTSKNENGERESSEFRMLWKPDELLSCSEDETWNWFLVAGRQFIDGRERIALFDFAPDQRCWSIALPLDEIPRRMTSDQTGDNVALLDSKGLNLIARVRWTVREPWLLYPLVIDLVERGKFSDIEHAVEIIRKQKRLGFGLTPETMAARVLEYTGYIWAYYEKQHPDEDIVARLEEWHQQGSDAAQLAGALRHFYRSWLGKTLYLHVHTGDVFRMRGWRDEEVLLKASEELDKALEKEDPPLAAYTAKIRVDAARKGLQAIDDLCLACARRYPAEDDLFLAISSFLAPHFYGEPGDYLSFALPYSRMFESPDAELVYMMAANTTPILFHHQDEISWKTYDTQRVVKGLDEYMRRRMPIIQVLRMIFILRQRDNNPVEIDKALRYLMATSATMPHFQGQEIAERLNYDVPFNWEAIDKIREK